MPSRYTALQALWGLVSQEGQDGHQFLHYTPMFRTSYEGTGIQQMMTYKRSSDSTSLRYLNKSFAFFLTKYISYGMV